MFQRLKRLLPFSGRFQEKLFRSYALLLIISSQLVLLIFLLLISSSLRREAVYQLSQTSEKIVYKLDDNLSDMDSIATQIIVNDSLQEELVHSNQYRGPVNYYNNFLKREALQDVLFTVNTPLLTYDRLAIIDRNGNYVASGSLTTRDYVYDQNFETNYKPFFDRNPTGSSTQVCGVRQDSWSDKKDQLVFSYLRAIPNFSNSEEILGLVEVAQSYLQLEKVCQTATDEALDVVVLDECGEVLYPYQTLSAQDTALYADLADGSGGPLKLENGQRVYYYSQPCKESSWHVIVVQASADHLKTVYTLYVMALLFEIIFYTLAFIILYIVTRQVTEPIRQLRAMVERLEPEHQTLDTTQAFSNDEIILLGESFNRTLERLDAARQEKLLAERSRAQAHVLAMQAQMNPHFLYNTLMAISGIAEEAENQAIVNICSKLSHMLHYISSYKEEKITLARELEYTQNYLELMKVRYEDFLSYTIHCDEAALNCLIPKLVVQPVVENCFSHAFKNCSPPYWVSINITLQPKAEGSAVLCICISDNGEGFSQLALDSLQEKIRRYNLDVDTGRILKESSIGGLGLANIYLRLRLQCTTALELRAENTAKGGQITIFLPIS